MITTTGTLQGYLSPFWLYAYLVHDISVEVISQSRWIINFYYVAVKLQSKVKHSHPLATETVIIMLRLHTLKDSEHFQYAVFGIWN